MTAVSKTILIEQGSSFIWFFQLQNADTSPVDLSTGFSMRMEVRARQQATVQVSASTANDHTTQSSIRFGVDPANYATTYATPVPSNGWCMVELIAADTSLITVKTASYDVELVQAATVSEPERVYRIWEGGVTDDPNITQTAGEPVLV